jgi:hypothetical protein
MAYDTLASELPLSNIQVECAVTFQRRRNKIMRELINGAPKPFPQQVSPELPISPSDVSRSTTIPIPIVYGQTAGSIEYNVLTERYPANALELEEKLNDASRDGWSLFQIIQQKEELLLIFFRQTRRR